MKNLSNLQIRILVSAIYFPFLLLAAKDSSIFALTMAVICGASWHEYLSFRFVPVNFHDWVMHFIKVFLGSLPPLFVGIGASLEMGMGLLLLTLQGVVIYEIVKGKSLKQMGEHLSFFIFGFLYITISYSCLVEIQLQSNGYVAIWFLLFVVGLTDSGAYFAGKKFGKDPFFPHISPSKTWQGVYGGVAGAILVGFLLRFILKTYDFSFPNLFLTAIGAVLVSVASIFGDLFESMIKRSYGLKDSGKLIPGHGGVLDRFDGVMFAAIPLFFFVMMRGGFR